MTTEPFSASLTAESALSKLRDEERIEQASRHLASDPARALPLAEDILQRTSEFTERDRRLRARALEVKGNAQRELGDIGAALLTLRLALLLIPEEDAARRAAVLRNLSVTYEKLGDLDAALEFAIDALEQARLDGDEEVIADAELTVGVGRSRCGDAEAGLIHYERVLERERANGQSLRQAAILNNIGINLKNMGRLDEALQRQEEAIGYADRQGQAAGATVRSNMGETLWRLGRNDEALEVLAMAIDLAESAGFLPAKINARVTYGQVLSEVGKEQEAVVAIEQALEEIESSGSKNYASDAHLALSRLHKTRGDYVAALRHYEAFHDAERDQLSAQAQQTAAVSQVRLGLAEAQHAAEVAHLRSVEVARAYEELRILHAELMAVDVEKTRQLAKMDQERQTDPLTGLANRRALDAHLNASIAWAVEEDQGFCLAMCDIDRFKDLNDTYGHPMGDLVLRQIAALLSSGCRSEDLVARYGGEEFCILFHDARLIEAVGMAERLRREVAEFDWSGIESDLQVSISVGVAELTPNADGGVLVASADAWLYAAKREGRNRVAWADGSLEPGTL